MTYSAHTTYKDDDTVNVGREEERSVPCSTVCTMTDLALSSEDYRLNSGPTKINVTDIDPDKNGERMGW